MKGVHPYARLARPHRHRFFEQYMCWQPKFLNMIVFCVMAAYFGGECINDNMTLGQYATLLKLYLGVGKNLTRINRSLSYMQRASVL